MAPPLPPRESVDHARPAFLRSGMAVAALLLVLGVGAVALFLAVGSGEEQGTKRLVATKQTQLEPAPEPVTILLDGRSTSRPAGERFGVMYGMRVQTLEQPAELTLADGTEVHLAAHSEARPSEIPGPHAQLLVLQGAASGRFTAGSSLASPFGVVTPVGTEPTQMSLEVKGRQRGGERVRGEIRIEAKSGDVRLAPRQRRGGGTRTPKRVPDFHAEIQNGAVLSLSVTDGDPPGVRFETPHETAAAEARLRARIRGARVALVVPAGMRGDLRADRSGTLTIQVDAASTAGRHVLAQVEVDGQPPRREALGPGQDLEIGGLERGRRPLRDRDR